MTIKYLCGVDYQHDMSAGLASFFDSVEELKAKRSCWHSCGIVKLISENDGSYEEIVWIEPQDFTKIT